MSAPFPLSPWATWRPVRRTKDSGARPPLPHPIPRHVANTLEALSPAAPVPYRWAVP
jgi:hypothetical protein